MRILITGSRDWDDYNTIARAISIAIDDLISANPNDKEIVIVDGACSTGADELAHEFANKLSGLMNMPREKTTHRYSIKTERHLAKWQSPCAKDCKHKVIRGPMYYYSCAGPTRNKLMVSLGADICLAFIKNGSRGASGTAKLAEQAGIKVVRYTA